MFPLCLSTYCRREDNVYGYHMPFVPGRIYMFRGGERTIGLTMRITTWNVKSLFASGKLGNAVFEITV